MSSFRIFLICTFAQVCLSDPLLINVINSIDAFVKYNLENTDDVNLMILQSLRVIEGSVDYLSTALQDGGAHTDLPVKAFTTLKDDIHKLSALTLPRTETEEVSRVWRLVGEPWLPPAISKYKVVDPLYRWDAPVVSDHEKNGYQSVHAIQSRKLGGCLQEVVSNRRTLPSKQHRVTKNCLSRHNMLASNTPTQNLYLQLHFFCAVEMYGFKDFVNRELMLAGVKGGITEMQLKLCSNAFYHIQKLTDNGQIIKWDEFLHLSFVCGSTGFMQFFHADWLALILSKQLPRGCFNSKFVDNVDADCAMDFSVNAINTLSVYMLFLASRGGEAYQSHVAISGTNFIKEGIHLPEDTIKVLNGELPELGKRPEKKQQPSNAEMTVIPIAGIGLVLLLFCLLFACRCKKKGEQTNTAWKLPIRISNNNTKSD